MKKTLTFLLLFAVVVIGLNISTAKACFDCPDGTQDQNSNTGEYCPVVVPTPSPEPKESLGGGLCIPCFYPSISNNNYVVAVDENEVSVSWSFPQIADGEVRVYNEEGLLSSVHSTDGAYTAPTVKFTITTNGKYTVQPVSFWQGKEELGKITEINITGNELSSTGYNFKPSLLTEQIEELLELLYKEFWTETDKANWEYATN